MCETILTYEPYIELVSHNSHLVIVNESLILVIRAATIIFMVATLVIYEKVLIKRCYTSKDLSYF